jgi:hypothetical protein
MNQDIIAESIQKSSRDKLSKAATDEMIRRVNGELMRFTADEKARFIECLEETPSVHKACVRCGISRVSANEAARQDPEFALAWHEALEAHVDDVEEVMFQRAKNPHAQNTVAGIFMLKAKRRDEFAEQIKVEHDVRTHITVELIPPREDYIDAEPLGEM